MVNWNLSKAILLANVLAATTFAQPGAAPQGKGALDPSFIIIVLFVLGIFYFVFRKEIYGSMSKKTKVTMKCIACNQLFSDGKKYCNKCGRLLISPETIQSRKLLKLKLGIAIGSLIIILVAFVVLKSMGITP
jgi:hypothetical protein